MKMEDMVIRSEDIVIVDKEYAVVVDPNKQLKYVELGSGILKRLFSSNNIETTPFNMNYLWRWMVTVNLMCYGISEDRRNMVLEIQKVLENHGIGFLSDDGECI
jgi:hypothetical protein